MALGDIMVHVGQSRADAPVDAADPTTWAEGEPDEAPVLGTPFPCCLFLPLPGQDNNRGRQFKRPTLLFEEADDLGNPIVVTSEMELLLTAPELTGDAPVRWQVDGDPQPFGPPGTVIGFQAILLRVTDAGSGQP